MKKDIEKETPATPGLSRRKVLGLLGAAAAAPLVGRVQGPAYASAVPTPAATPTRRFPSCVVKPQQTEGPYFVDETLNRSDIRPDPSDDSVVEGVPLRLEFYVSRIDENACTPLSDALVDVWQCDAQGVYSDVEDFNGLFDTRGKKFLRGHQVTDASGVARFTTIYPGWYPGRTVHIHFKIRTDPESQTGYEFTSQLYFDEAITDEVHARPPYAAKGARTLKNEGDGIFRRGGDQLMLPLAQDQDGYVGTFEIGLEVA
jgi:protocatechuate 3,4-dioxygenase beta subunit